MLLVLWPGSLISYYPLVIRQSILPLRPVRPDQILHLSCLQPSQKSDRRCPPPPPPPGPSTLSCTRSSSAHLLTGCHVQQASPRQCLAFLSPLTEVGVKPLGFAQTGIQLGGAGPADTICLLRSLVFYLLHLQVLLTTLQKQRDSREAESNFYWIEPQFSDYWGKPGYNLRNKCKGQATKKPK